MFPFLAVNIKGNIYYGYLLYLFALFIFLVVWDLDVELREFSQILGLSDNLQKPISTISQYWGGANVLKLKEPHNFRLANFILSWAHWYPLFTRNTLFFGQWYLKFLQNVHATVAIHVCFFIYMLLNLLANYVFSSAVYVTARCYYFILYKLLSVFLCLLSNHQLRDTNRFFFTMWPTYFHFLVGIFSITIC